MGVGLTRYEPLYLKYRPQVLADLVGQAAVVKTLTNAITNNRLSHAYLFTGPRGTGKTSTARILARSLNCGQGPTANPCCRCSACQEITAGTSPAVLEIDAASNNSVDDARVLIERAPLVALGGRFKFYIVDECHMLTREAFNALLKTIEEPPPNVVFVLATTEEHKVPATIVSRCQRLNFRLAHEDDLAGLLRRIAEAEKIAIEEAAIAIIARRALGGMRDALSLLDQASLLSQAEDPVTVDELLSLLGVVREDILLSLSKEILEANGENALTIVAQLTMEGREPAVLAVEIARHFLNLIKASYLEGKASSETKALSGFVIGSSDYVNGLSEQARGLDRTELAQMVDKLNQIAETCRRTTQPALHLELGLLSLCHRQDIELLKNLRAELDNLKQALNVIQLSSATPNLTNAGSNRPVNPQPQEQQEMRMNLDLALHENNLVLDKESSSSALDDEPKSKSELKDENDQAICVSSANQNDPELELFWSKIQDELRQRSPSVGALLSSFPFPLSLTNTEFLIGVPNDLWRNNVEKRLEPIRVACHQVLGRNVNIRVKVISEKIPPQQSKVGLFNDEKKVEDELVGSRESNNACTGGPITKTVAWQGSPDKDKPISSVGPSEKDEPVVIAGRAVDSLTATANCNASSMIREAYKLFEGPGSRLIG